MKKSFALHAVAAALLLPSLLTLGACAQAPARPDTAVADIAAPAESEAARIAYFVHYGRNGDNADLAKELDRGIDIDVFDTLSQTALIAAVSHVRYDTAKLLLDRGADVKLADPSGWAPLLHATYAGAGPELLQLLLDRGADINALNDRGVSALYLASAAGREPQVTFLLAHGADPALKTKGGYTAVRVAQLKGLDRIVALLEGRTPPPLAGTPSAVRNTH